MEIRTKVKRTNQRYERTDVILCFADFFSKRVLVFVMFSQFVVLRDSVLCYL